MSITQEKAQVRSAPQPEGIEGGGWAADKSARTLRGLRTRSGASEEPRMYNRLPPGSNIEDQEVADVRGPSRARGGRGTGTQATDDVTPESLRLGFSRKRMRPADEYDTPADDAGMFYGTVEVDGVEGFVERGNVLDRL
jgi:hypothetical protein